jgi:hypothetical protein
LLARIPVIEEDSTYTLRKKVERNGKKFNAAQLRGDDKSNDLTDALASDKHLRASLSIPGKDNGFDIEGLAVVGDRIFIGLRGPVLRGWAVILEVEVNEGDDDASKLKLKKIGRDDRRYRKHFLQLADWVFAICACTVPICLFWPDRQWTWTRPLLSFAGRAERTQRRKV